MPYVLAHSFGAHSPWRPIPLHWPLMKMPFLAQSTAPRDQLLFPFGCIYLGRPLTKVNTHTLYSPIAMFHKLNCIWCTSFSQLFKWGSSHPPLQTWNGRRSLGAQQVPSPHLLLTSRSQKYLRISLPPGCTLWSTFHPQYYRESRGTEFTSKATLKLECYSILIAFGLYHQVGPIFKLWRTIWPVFVGWRRSHCTIDHRHTLFH